MTRSDAEEQFLGRTCRLRLEIPGGTVYSFGKCTNVFRRDGEVWLTVRDVPNLVGTNAFCIRPKDARAGFFSIRDFPMASVN